MTSKKVKSANQMFHQLLKEVETMGESRKRRIAKTKHNILTVKTKINRQHENLLIGTFVRHHINATVVTEVCGECKNRNKIVKRLEVISKSHINGETKVSNVINSHGMYEFHYDIPITTFDHILYIPVCVDCLLTDAKERAGESTDTAVADQRQ